MRTVHLFLERDENRFVVGLNAANPAGTLSIAQNDTLELLIHDLVRAPQPSRNAFSERPLDFSSIRASIGTVDTAPTGGTFKLRVDGETTAALTWPADLSTPELIAAWKATVLAALIALPSVGTGNAILLDDADTPAHFFFFKWTNPDNELEIEVVENELLPWIETAVVPSADASGLTQLVKLTQLPAKMATTFTRPASPVVTVSETRPGAVGTNAEQTLYVPTLATGSFALTWDGTATKTLAVGTVTAASIATALNAIVANGATAPSFRVEERATNDGRRFAVEFIGALAAAEQDMLVVAMHDQTMLPWARGILALAGNVQIEHALVGEASATLIFELVITTADGEETFLREVVVVNDMTGPGTLTAAAEAGAVVIIEREVFVDLGTAEAFADVAAGVSYSLPTTAVSSTFVIPRSFSDKHPDVSAVYRTSAPGDAEEWIDLDDNLYIATHTSETSTTVQLLNSDNSARNVDIVDPESEDYATRFKFFFAARDTRVMMFTHKHTWDDVLDTLPAGQSLRAKLAALEAALGQLGGSLKIPPTSLDLTALVAALVALIRSDATMRGLFTDLLTTLITDAAIIRAIATELSKYDEFIETLKKAFENDELLSVLFEQLTKNLAFESFVRALVLETLQGGAGTLPPGTVLFVVPSFEFAFPPPQEIPAPSKRTEVFADVQVTTAEGTAASGATTVTTSKASQAQFSEQSTVRYDLLSPALFEAEVGGDVTGLLSPTALAKKWTATAAVNARTATTRRGRDWKTGTILTRQNGHWYDARVDGTTLWPCEMETELLRLDVTADMLFVGSRFALAWLLQAALEGNAIGTIDMIVEVGATAENGSIAIPTWAQVFAQRIPLTPTLALHQFSLALTREIVVESIGTVSYISAVELTVLKSVDGFDYATLSQVTIRGVAREVLISADLEFEAVYSLDVEAPDIELGDSVTVSVDRKSGIYKRYGQSNTFAVESAAFALRVRVANFDCENIEDARGCMKLKIANPTASIAPL